MRLRRASILNAGLLPPTFVATDVPQYETDALMAFFHATDGPNWTYNTGWGVDPVVGNWYGVTVVNGHVTKLSLYTNKGTLSGPGAPFLVALSELDYLRLDTTGVTGDISGFNSLVNLTTLTLNSTGVTGDIGGFSSLVELTRLILYSTGVTIDTIPVFVKHSGNLQIGGTNPAPTWGTVESPTQVTLNIVANLNNMWAVTVTGGIPTWVQDMVNA